MDAFAHPWDGEHLWLFPPVSLVVPAIRKLCASFDASGVLICPFWPTAAFFSVILPDGYHFANFVDSHQFFSPVYYSHPSVRSKMFKGVKPWDTLGLFITSDAEFPFETSYSKELCLLGGCSRCD